MTSRLPIWLKKPPGSASSTNELKRLLRKSKLNTVCEEARCPNISECFGRGTATFMILGDVCTRGCRFCSVNTGKPHFSQLRFSEEAKQVAEAAENLNLKHVVVTSVARDDLEDGGASGFVATIGELRSRLAGVTIEVLIPDLRGNWNALAKIVSARPDVLNHNLETVPRLYRKVRPGAQYLRSLELLEFAKKEDPKISVKTGIMLGLGEEFPEVVGLMQDSMNHGVDIFTGGQYMQPTKDHLPVDRYLPPDEFEKYQKAGEELGFKQVFIGPLVRSSYHADEVMEASLRG
jgi:lipoyl synthase